MTTDTVSRNGLNYMKSPMKLLQKKMVGYGSILFAWGMLSGCGSSLCENELLQAVGSPDGSLKVVVFERDCGATTGFNRQVAILKNSKRFPKRASIDSFLCLGGQPKVDVVWLSPTEVRIRYESGGKVFRKSFAKVPIKVSFEEFDKAGGKTNGERKEAK